MKWSQDDSNMPVIFDVICYLCDLSTSINTYELFKLISISCEKPLQNNKPNSGNYSQMPLGKSAAAYFNCWHNMDNFYALRKSRVHASSCILYYAT